MEWFGEFLLEFIGILIFRYPGALIRWVLFRKKSLKEYINDDWYENAMSFGLFLGIVAVAYNLIILI